MEDLYGEIVKSLMAGHQKRDVATPANWLGIRGYDVGDVKRRGFSDLEGLEPRGFGDEGEEGKMERRESDDGLMARESGDGGELDARDFE